MTKLLVNTPSGVQELITVGTGGAYMPSEPARTLWDERTDGPMPAIQPGGMVRVGNSLQVDAALLAAAQAAEQTKAAEATRLAEFDQALRSDTVAANIAGMTNAQYETFWTNRTAAQKDKMLQVLVRAYARSRA